MKGVTTQTNGDEPDILDRCCLYASGDDALRIRDMFPPGEVVHILNPTVLKCDRVEFYVGQTVRFALEVNSLTRVMLRREWLRLDEIVWRSMLVQGHAEIPERWYDLEEGPNADMEVQTLHIGRNQRTWVRAVMEERIQFSNEDVTVDEDEGVLW